MRTSLYPRIYVPYHKLIISHYQSFFCVFGQNQHDQLFDNLIFALLTAADSIIVKVRELEVSGLNHFTALVFPFSAAYCPICALSSSMLVV